MTILTCKQTWSAYHFKYFQNNTILKLRDSTNPLILILKAYSTPEEGGGFIFSPKMRRKDELKGTQSNCTPSLRIF